MSASEGLSGVLKSLVHLPAHTAPRYQIAVRAGLAIAIPLAVSTAFGHLEIGLQAAAGAFTALYAANATAAERANVLPFVAIGLLLSALLGVLLTPWVWMMAAGIVVVAVIAAALCFAFRLGPPGPIFFVLVYGLASNVTAVVDGRRLNDPVIFLAATAGGALFAYLLAILPIILPSVRAQPSRSLRELFPKPWLGPDEQLLVARVALASAAGATISLLWLDAAHTYWTACASIAVIGLAGGRTVSLTRGLHRTIGTLVGAGLFIAVAPLGEHQWLLVCVIGALQFIIELVITRNYALALAFITPLVLLITTAVGAGADPASSAWERVIDTAVGAALAVVTAVMHRRDPAARN